MNPRETIGIVGLGNMGYPIAQNLIKAGYAIAGREIDQARWQPTDHLLYVNSLEALIERTSVLLLSLPDGHTVQSIIEQLLNGCANRSITVVDTSTIGAKASQAVEKLARSSKLRYLDSPVSGGVRGAVAGTLAVMCAGTEEPIQRGITNSRVLQCQSIPDWPPTRSGPDTQGSE